MFSAFSRVIASVFAFVLLIFSSQTNAQTIMLPDRCPEPCEIGGTHVSDDYQRLTTPFRIRNGASGEYLSVDGRGVSVQPLVENDNRFLWVLLPGPSLRYNRGDITSIADGSGFENRAYKLINLYQSLALMSDGGGAYVNGTHLGSREFWVFRKNPNDSNYLIYNPIVSISQPQFMYDEGSRAEVSPANASLASMRALTQPPGQRGVSVGAAADFGKAGFTWHFDEAPKPRDLARLTIKNVKAISVSTGRDGNTDILLKTIKYAAEYGPMIYSLGTSGAAKGAASGIGKGLKSGAKATGRGIKSGAKAAGRGLKAGAKAAGKKAKSVADDLAQWWAKRGTKEVSHTVKASLQRRLLDGVITVGSKSFRGLWWLTKTTGKTAVGASKKFVKLGAHASRSVEKLAKKSLPKLKNLADKKKKELVGFLKDNKKVDDYLTDKLVKTIGKKTVNQARTVLKSYLDDASGDADFDSRQFASTSVNASKGISLFERTINRSRNRELILNDSRSATYADRVAVSAQNYEVCKETKTYSLPQRNPPYFRIDSTQNLKAVAERAQTLSDTWEGTDSGAAWAKGGQVVLDLLMFDVSPILNEITKATDKVDDDLEIRINDISVWPNGGHDDRKIGAGHAPLNVGVEYIFNRGDDVTINLIEVDEGGPFASGDDSLGNLTIPTTQLYDIEEYEGAYIQQVSEGSLYEVTFTVEPLYVPTPKEVARKAVDDVECAPVIAQAKAEDFARVVERTRIEGRLSLMEKFGEDALQVVDATAGWADHTICPSSDSYYDIIGGEWRVGRFDKNGNRDRSVTWTNTFNRSRGTSGEIITPSGNGKWNRDSFTPGMQKQKFVRDPFSNASAKWEWQEFEDGPWDERKHTVDTCEIYAAMYDKNGLLGGRGREVYPYGKGERDEAYYEVGKEISFAVRGDQFGGEFVGLVNQIADKSSKEFKAVSFLQDYYDAEEIPTQQDGVDSNLHLTASGPAEFWLEKISDEPVGKGAGIGNQEPERTKNAVKEAISGSWEIGSYKKNAPFPQMDIPEIDRFTGKTKPVARPVWTFTSDGIFIVKPEYDFWFTPPIWGNWEYIGDQRIEVTTKLPVKIPVSFDISVASKLNKDHSAAKEETLGTTFIVKMAQRIGKPEELDGFFVQDSDGAKVIWSSQIHPGKSPFEVPELYNEAYFDLLASKSKASGAPDGYLEKREAEDAANKIAMAAKLAELKLLKSKSPCNMGYLDEKHPGNTALHGRWRVGQYDLGGEKKYGWNYKKTDSPYDDFAKKSEPNIASWRSDDVRILDDEKSAYIWETEYLGAGKYQQEWVFPDKNARDRKVAIRTRIGNDKGMVTKYLAGEPAPPTARFQDVKFDYSKAIFVMNGDSNWMQQLDRKDIKLPWWQDDGCNYSLVDLPDEISVEQRLQVHFIYHENGDKEFYTTKQDGSLYLWGLQDVDRSKYDYKYDNKIMTPVQLAEWCTGEIPYQVAKSGFPFTYVDENVRNGMVILQNEGTSTYRIFRDAPAYAGSSKMVTYQYQTLRPGGYVEFTGKDAEKITVIDDRKIIKYVDRYEACIGSKKLDISGSTDITSIQFGEGFEHPTKETDEITVREACSSRIRGENYPRRPAVVQFYNKGSTGLDIFRLDSIGNLISRDGKALIISPDNDPSDDANRYKDIHPIVTLYPGQFFKLKTRVDYAFTAIKRGTQRKGRFYNEYFGKVMDNVLQGERETCYGKFKISEPVESIVFSNELNEKDFGILAEERKKKRQEDKRIANNLGLVSDTNSAPNTVSESAKVGTPVGITALAIDGDEKDTVSYSLTSPSWTNPLIIDAATGVVAVGQPLDREAYEKHTIKITATSSDGAISEAEFVIDVEDVNEFAVGPVTGWSIGWERNSDNSSSQIRIETNHVANEGYEVGSWVILTALAEDKDATDSVRYSLSDDAGGLFVIDSVSGEVRSAGALDYEGRKKYEIELVATSTDGTTSSTKTTIAVQNANDGPVGTPTDADPAPNAVLENSPIGTPVGITVQAEDIDVDDKITYKLTSCLGCNHYYGIDPETGVVVVGSLFGNIDLESTDHIYAPGELAEAERIWVTAESSDGSRSSQEIRIEILDANEYAIGPTDDEDAYGNQVAENAAIGTPVGITAFARDYDAKATVNYRLSDDAGGRFKINAQTGVITLAGVLDYETAQSYRVSVVSTSNDGSTSQKDFDINVSNAEEFQIGSITDIDNAPDTVAEGSWGTISMTPVGITAHATDGDFNSSVRYSLKGGRMMDYHNFRREDHSFIDNHIAIDVETGVVSAWSGPDFETSPTITFTVVATSNDGSTSEAEFTIEVTNVNEHGVADLRDSDPAVDELSENAQVGAYAGITATARDADSGAQVSYSMAAKSDERFAIDSQSGVVTLVGELDAEKNDRHYLTIVATSSDGSTTEENFLVTVIDVNEYDVAWEAWNNYRRINIREDAAIGTGVQLGVTALDRDPSDSVTFELVNSRDVPFVIDPRTGEVTVSQSLNEDEITSYNLEIRATSTDGSQATKTIEVPVEGINDSEISALIDSDETWNAVFENAAGGTPVGITAFAEDRDGSDTVTYKISDRWSPFEIDPITGVIAVAQYGTDLDTESKAVEAISVVATSTDGTSSWQTFEVTVSNVNEFEVRRPYDNDNAPNEVPENSPIGTVVGITALAEDLDAGDVVTYRMGEYDDGLFAIDPNTGIVTVARLIDFETTWRSNISVLAVSSDGMEPSSPFAIPESPFEIKILPVDEFDLTPFIDTDDAPNEVADTVEWNTPVGITVSTSDADQDLYGPVVIKFAVVDANGNDYYDQPFLVEDDGRVIVYDSAKLKALGEGEHTIYVRAKSSDGSTRIEEFALTVLGPVKWYDNPQGPRVETDFPTVSDADRQICVDADENRSSPATYNNEVAYFDCLAAAAPEVKWRDNPQGPRVETDYVGVVSSDALDYCRYYDEESSSQSYNNEKAYFDCLDPYLPAAQPEPLPESPALACARQQGFEPELSDQTGQVTITTGHPSYVEVQRLDADGNTELVTYLEPGQTYEAQVQRGVVFVAFDPDGLCVDAGKPRESRNSFVFGQGANTDQANGGDTANDGTGAEPSNEPAPIQSWYDNPQDPRGANAGSTYAEVLDADWDQCVANNEDPALSTYNDEYAFYDCLDSYRPVNPTPIEQQPTDTGTDIGNEPGNDTGNQSGTSGLACAQQYGLEPESSDATGLVTITNSYSSYIDVQRVDPGGGSTQVTYLETGQNFETDSQRGVVFVAFDAEGRCIGAGQPRESRNSYAFGG